MGMAYTAPIKATNTYDANELNSLRAFLRQTNADGKLNLTGIGIGLTISDTANWNTDETWVAKVRGLKWNAQTPKKITKISWYGGLSGNLDASAFTELDTLDCEGNQLTSLDVTKNTELELLGCGDNQLTSLDVSKNTKLKYLDCYNNPLTSLDVTKNTELEFLSCGENQLTSLDVTKNTKLEFLSCDDNPLTSLDVTKNTELESLYCVNTQLAALDLSKKTKLKSLDCNDTPLKFLDISQNTELESLRCVNTQLTSLNVSKNTELERLYCSYNQLTSLDLSKNTKLKYLDCSYNELPLSQLYPFMSLFSKWVEITVGNQTNVFFKDTTLAVYGKLDLSSESEFRGAKTRFEINTETENYTISGGVIRFLKKGTYQITLSNDSIYSYTLYGDNATPAVVKTGTITVNNISSELIPSEDEIRVFPNPSKDKLFISGQKPIQRLILYNVNGAVLLQIEKPEKDFDINISSLAPGMYFLNIDGQTQKIIKN